MIFDTFMWAMGFAGGWLASRNSRGSSQRWKALKSTTLFAKWLVLKRLGYDPHRIQPGHSLTGYYRTSLAIFKDAERIYDAHRYADDLIERGHCACHLVVNCPNTPAFTRNEP